MMRFEQILVGVDLHHGDRMATERLLPATQAAIDEAVWLSQTTQATITLCAVLELSDQALYLMQQHEHLAPTVKDVAWRLLEQQAAALRQRGLKVQASLRFGRPWEELIREALQLEADMLLVGTRERGKTARLLFGSTAQKLIRLAPLPVWVVKPAAVREVREIVVATDFSDNAQQALHHAVQLAQQLPCKVWLVHALEYPFESYLRTSGVSEADIQRHKQRVLQEAEEHLQQQLRDTDARTLTYGIRTQVLEGAADVVIPEFLVQTQADLLVMGTQGRSGLSGLLLGNTAERMLVNLPCSLLAVKPPGFQTPVTL
ncbi:MAG: universal stress protein [Planctomycetaceae bacterium]|nr:MAG: universal stress protein [Planctomycetaceae bacterium]